MTTSDHELWIFGYGSLMWRPGFAYVERSRARLVGYSRGFCVTSVHHRGSAARPGLVLGLDRGGLCEGVAYRVEAAIASETLHYLRAREQVNGVYREARLPVELHAAGGTSDPRIVTAVAYLVERAHPSYAGHLSLAQQARLIRAARGLSGVNLDYVINTLRHMAKLGIREPELQRLMVVIGALFARESCAGLASPRAAALRRTESLHHAVPRYVRTMRPDVRRRFCYRRNIA